MSNRSGVILSPVAICVPSDALPLHHLRGCSPRSYWHPSHLGSRADLSPGLTHGPVTCPDTPPDDPSIRVVSVVSRGTNSRATRAFSSAARLLACTEKGHARLLMGLGGSVGGVRTPELVSRAGIERKLEQRGETSWLLKSYAQILCLNVLYCG